MSEDREGWSRTKRHSKKAHYFVDERSLCSGSAPAAGPLASVAATIGADVCPDCLAGFRIREKRRVEGRRPPRSAPRLAKTLRRFAAAREMVDFDA